MEMMFRVMNDFTYKTIENNIKNLRLYFNYLIFNDFYLHFI